MAYVNDFARTSASIFDEDHAERLAAHTAHPMPFEIPLIEAAADLDDVPELELDQLFLGCGSNRSLSVLMS